MITTATTKTSADKGYQTQEDGMSTRERIMSSTMSVDEYFDELIAQVHKDYATL